VRAVKFTPQAEDDLEAIWHYGWQNFGEVQADNYIDHLSAVFQLPGNHQIGILRPELSESICVLPLERHVIYFLQTDAVVIVIHVQNQDAGRHLHWR
jgi:Plasmid stabilization system protein